MSLINLLRSLRPESGGVDVRAKQQAIDAELEKLMQEPVFTFCGNEEHGCFEMYDLNGVHRGDIFDIGTVEKLRTLLAAGRSMKDE